MVKPTTQDSFHTMPHLYHYVGGRDFVTITHWEHIFGFFVTSNHMKDSFHPPLACPLSPSLVENRLCQFVVRTAVLNHAAAGLEVAFTMSKLEPSRLFSHTPAPHPALSNAPNSRRLVWFIFHRRSCKSSVLVLGFTCIDFDRS